MNQVPSIEKLSFGRQHSISALELQLQLQEEQFIGAENKAQSYIDTSAVVLAIIGGFSITQASIGDTEKLLVVLLVVSFVYVFVLALLALSPRTMFRVIPIDEIKFAKWRTLAHESRDIPYQEAMLDIYRDVMVKNNHTLTSKLRFANLSRYGVYVELMVALGLIVRIVV